jgi:hypothetical protein
MAAQIIDETHDKETDRLLSRTGRCPCGARVDLSDPMDNECPRCRRWFNGSGQELVPPELWEEPMDEES